MSDSTSTSGSASGTQVAEQLESDNAVDVLLDTAMAHDEPQSKKCIICNKKGTALRPLMRDQFDKLLNIAKFRRTNRSGHYRLAVRDFPVTYDETAHYYHVTCYKNFTAVSKEKLAAIIDHPIASTSQSVQLRSAEKIIPSEGQILQSKCVICLKKCKKSRKGTEKLIKCTTTSGEKSLRDDCQITGDNHLLNYISKDFAAAEVAYHATCRKKLYKKAQIERKRSVSCKPHSVRAVHKKAFGQVKNYIEEYILKSGKFETLRNIFSTYSNILKAADVDVEENKYYENNLLRKIAQYFTNKLLFTRVKGDTIIYSSNINMTDAAQAQFLQENEQKAPEKLVKRVAFMLRENIKHHRGLQLNDVASLQEILTAEDNLPDLLHSFMDALLEGPRFTSNDVNLNPRLKSIGADIIFAVSRGKIIPVKHLLMGLGVKTMTGKKELLQILNKLGHSINPWLEEELETRMADDAVASKNVVPTCIKKLGTLCTKLAFDNYDENTETLSGAGTLHETVGICVQNVTTSEGETEEIVQTTHVRKKRKFDGVGTSLEPYAKKLSLQGVSWDAYEPSVPSSYSDAERRDLLFLFTHYCIKEKTPMWIGYNSMTVADNSVMQTVEYMPNFNNKSTDPAMVHYTIKLTSEIARECNQEYGIVTYDLAIAKPAMQIKSMEDNFQNIFVMFGAFHIYLAYFGALGKIVAGSGLTDILCETGVLASNSSRGFLMGKHYNRAKRLHPMFALALRKLHIESFFRTTNIETPEKFEMYLSNLLNGAEYREDTMPEGTVEFIEKYQTYESLTLNGKHGATAQFWIQYIILVENFLKISRAVRTNDVDLFAYSLRLATSLFFATNHQNYARWMVLFERNLNNIDREYPGLKEILQNGGLSVKRNNIPFSAAPVDLTLEQTINRDAASRLTGIAAFTNATSARQRWAITRSQRAQAVSALKELAGISKYEDVMAELKPSRMERDNRDLDEIVNFMKDSANPFSGLLEGKPNLYNIGSGKAATDEVRGYLLNAMETGRNLRKTFIEECCVDSDRFSKPIKRQKVVNFENDGIKIKVPHQDKKIQEVSLTNRLFSRIVAISIKKDIDLGELLQYSLTEIPLSFATIDGIMSKTQKSKIIEHLEKIIPCVETPARVDVDLVDGMVLIHSTLAQTSAKTFGDWASFLLRKLCSTEASRIDVIFDLYVTPSIKQGERERRGLTDLDFKIFGPEQTLPKVIKEQLKNFRFKHALTIFLADEWKKNAYKEIIRGKSVYFTQGNKCFATCSDQPTEEVPEYQCQHEEADTRLYFHFKTILETSRSKDICFRVKSNDTDVIIIFLGNIGKHMKNTKCFIEYGTGSTKRTINLSQLSKKLGQKTAEALIGLHSFTGCDFTSSFRGKGKVRPFMAMIKNSSFEQAMQALGANEKLPEAEFKNIEAFVAKIYGITSQSINEARLQLFLKIAGPRKSHELSTALRRVEPSMLPPCQTVLERHTTRCNYVALLWRNADRAVPARSTPQENGWNLQKDGLMPDWDSKPPFPEKWAADDTLVPDTSDSEISSISDSENEQDSS